METPENNNEDLAPEEKKKSVGRSYIGSKEIFRIVVGPRDYRPYCFCKHETPEEALACPEALENHKNGVVPSR